MFFFKKQQNWILKQAVIVYGLFITLYFLLDLNLTPKIQYGSDKPNSLWLTLITIVTIAPIFEELIFRGVFLKTKIRYVFYIIFLMVAGITFYKSDIVLIGSFILTIIAVILIFELLEKSLKKPISILKVIIFSLAFSIFHSNEATFNNVSNGVMLLNTFGSGLFLTWIVINYGLFKAMLVHAIYNGCSFLIYLLVISVSYVPSSIHCENDVCVEWSLVSAFNNKSVVIQDQNGINGSSVSIYNLIQKSTLNSVTEAFNITISDPYKRYDIKIYSEESKLLKDNELDILKLLHKANLIEVIDKN